MRNHPISKYFILLLHVCYVFSDELFVVGGVRGEHFIKQLGKVNADYFCRNTCLVWIRKGMDAMVCGNDFKGKWKHIQRDGHYLRSEFNKDIGYCSDYATLCHALGEEIYNSDGQKVFNLFLRTLDIKPSEKEDPKLCDMGAYVDERKRNLSIRQFIRGNGIQNEVYMEPPFFKEQLEHDESYILHNNNGVHSQLFAWVGRNVDVETKNEVTVALKEYQKILNGDKNYQNIENERVFLLVGRWVQSTARNFIEMVLKRLGGEIHRIKDENVMVVRDRMEPWQFRINFQNWGPPGKYNPSDNY